MRLLARLIVVALLAALTGACTSSPDRPSGGPSPDPAVRATTAAPAEVTEESIVSDLAAAGVAVVDPDTGQPLAPVSEPASPVTVGADQLPGMVGSISTLTGLTAAQLDGLASWPAIDGPVGALPPSLLVAGWLVGASTPASDLARTWMGGQDPRAIDQLVVPSGVLDLFLSDILPRGEEGAASAAASPAAYVRSADPKSVCEQFQSFIVDSINQVFQAIGRLPNVSGGSIFSDILNGVINVLNLGKDALQFFLVSGTKVLLQPVVDAVASVASVVALASFAVKTVLPWSGEILPDPRQPTLGTAPVEGRWTLALTSPGPQEWPAQVEGCARWAGVTLPSLKPRNADVAWQITSQSPTVLLQPGTADTKVKPDGTADMRWSTLVEPPDVAAGKERYDGAVHVRSTVHRKDLEDFSPAMIRLFLGFLPSALPALVKDTMAGVLRPKLDQALKALESIRDLTVAGFVFPIYHEKEETPSPSPTPTPPPTGATFCQGFEEMLQWREAQGTGGLDKEVTAGQVRMLRAIIPLGNRQERRDGGVIATIWQMWVDVDPTSPTQNPGAIGQAMIDLGYYEAAQRIGTNCGIALERIGAG